MGYACSELLFAVYRNTQEVLRLDNGDITTEHINHYCAIDLFTGKRCHDDSPEGAEEALIETIVVFCKFYIGRTYAVPTVSRMTNVVDNLSMILFGFAHRRILFALVKKPDKDFLSAVEGRLAADEVGSRADDVQLLMGVREQKIYKAFVEDETTAWRMACAQKLVQSLDLLTYSLFGDGNVEHQLSLHDLVCPATSRIADCQQTLLDLVRGLPDHASEHWAVLDMIGIDRFAKPTVNRQICKYVRSQAFTYAAGIHRKLVSKLKSMPYSLHQAICTECTPGDLGRKLACQRFLKLKPCCQGPFGRALAKTFPTVTSMQSPLCQELLKMREKLATFNTRRSELAHAFGKRILLQGRKASSLAAFCQAEFIKQIYTRHLKAGGQNIGKYKALDLSTQQQFSDWTADLERMLPLTMQSQELQALAGDAQPADAGTEPLVTAKRFGNPLVFLYNKRLAAAKVVFGSGKLDDDAREEIRAAARRDLDDPAFAEVNRMEWQSRKFGLAAVADVGNEAQEDPSPVVKYDASQLWVVGSPALPVHPEVFRDFVKKQNGLDKNCEALNNGKFMIPSTDNMPLLTSASQAASCGSMLKSMCRAGPHVFTIGGPNVKHLVSSQLHD